MEISFQRSSRLGLSVLAFAALVIKPITIIPACTVLRPRPHTNPAKLVSTFLAGHMIATAILFDGRMALAAFLSIGGNPISRLGIVFAFLQPELYNWTATGLMIWSAAAKTEEVTAFTVDGGNDGIEGFCGDCAMDGIFAIGGWAPS